MITLSATHVEYTWRFRGGNIKALQSVSLQLPAGLPHIICGPSGSGKTTLALALAGLITAERGEISLEGTSVEQCLSDIAYVFQFPENIFFEDNIESELRQIARSHGNGTASMHFANLGINLDDIRAVHPFHLSEGYSRLVAIALQLAREPRVLILDEPTIGLDWKHQSRLISLLKKWVTDNRILVIIAHDLELMRQVGGRIWVLEDGRLAWSGETEALLENQELLECFSLAF